MLQKRGSEFHYRSQPLQPSAGLAASPVTLAFARLAGELAVRVMDLEIENEGLRQQLSGRGGSNATETH